MIFELINMSTHWCIIEKYRSQIYVDAFLLVYFLLLLIFVNFFTLVAYDRFLAENDSIYEIVWCFKRNAWWLNRKFARYDFKWIILLFSSRLHDNIMVFLTLMIFWHEKAVSCVFSLHVQKKYHILRIELPSSYGNTSH